MKFLKLSFMIICFLGLANSTCHAIWPFSPKMIQEKLDQQKLESLKNQITPGNSAFVFDMHGVVVQFSLPEALKAVNKMSFTNKLHFAKKTFKYFSWKNKNPKRAFEGVALEDREDDPAYVAQALAVMNPHVPNDETVGVLKTLKCQGYDIYGCSNIGERSYAYLKTKYPDAFASITACRTSNKQNNYHKKSDPKAYEETLEMISKSGKNYDQLVFVDDKQSNLTLAHKVDPRFVQLLLKDPKKLRPNLINLGVISDEKN